MAAYDINIPYPEPYDFEQERQLQHDERVRKSLRPEAMRTAILEQICLGMLQHGHAFNHLLITMMDSPVVDEIDRDGYLKYCSSRDARKLGEALMRAAANACLQQVREVDDDRPF